jgi:2-deoxy-D-gluconate 3-dehydrogenase
MHPLCLFIDAARISSCRNTERKERILSRIPAGRWGQPDDPKRAVVFVALAASDYIHGTSLAVDGGYLAR